MAAPTWVPGQVLSASDVNTWFVDLAAYKTSATTRTTLTVAPDPDLTLTLAPSAFYRVHAGIGYSCASGGISYNFSITAGTTGIFENATGGIQNPWNTLLAGSSNTVGGLSITGLLATGTGGTFAFQWASNTGPASLSVSAYSYLTATRIG